MAEKRMFTKKITNSDTFIDMQHSTQTLYFHLNMEADDDGFINNPKSIMRKIRCSDDDMKVLISKNYILPFESGVVVIKHWRLHNLIRKDRYHKTEYMEEMAQLEEKDNGVYRLLGDVGNQMATIGIPNDNQMATEVSIGKVSIGKDSKDLNTYAQSDLENLSMPEIETTIITLILNDKSEYAVVENQYKEWQELYPAVDIMQELRKMKGWLNANPTKRKTRRGIKRFINSWLSKSQDKGFFPTYVNREERPF